MLSAPLFWSAHEKADGKIHLQLNWLEDGSISSQCGCPKSDGSDDR